MNDAAATRGSPIVAEYLNINEVSDRTKIGRSTIYKWMSDGKFPQAHRRGEKCTRWLSSDIEAWIQDGQRVPS
jgi:prophage regulatory protein